MIQGGGKFGGGGAKVLSKFGQKGKGKAQKPQGQALKGEVKNGNEQKYLEKLKTIDSSLKVWVGGLQKNVTWKDLEKHFAGVAKPSLTHVYKTGKGVVCFKSEADVSTAIGTLSGTALKGSPIEVDVWARPEHKGDKAEKVKKPKFKVKQPAAKSKPGKQATAKVKPTVSKAEEKIKEQLKEVDASQKVWVGGLDESTNWQVLKKHFSQAGKPKLVHILSAKKGTAVVTFDDASDAQAAILSLNGSELKGKAIEVDVWSKPEKKSKGAQ